MSQWWQNAYGNEDINIIDQLLPDSSISDEDPTHGVSRPGKAPNKDRGRHNGAERLHQDYFSEQAVYDDDTFKRRFRVTWQRFRSVMHTLEAEDKYFRQQKDCNGLLGLTSYQKGTAALHVLVYGSSTDSFDEYVQMRGSTVSQTLRYFTRAVISAFGPIYLRHPTSSDILRILGHSERRGFPGMLGNIDCCKWTWKIAPQHSTDNIKGRKGLLLLYWRLLLWIWHALFGMWGCNNDINVLEASPLLNDIANGSYPPPVEYNLMEIIRNIPYWLADGIYPKWPVFVHTL